MKGSIFALVTVTVLGGSSVVLADEKTGGSSSHISRSELQQEMEKFYQAKKNAELEVANEAQKVLDKEMRQPRAFGRGQL
jgi:hypothetical protein